jgi:hypothetical protein
MARIRRNLKRGENPNAPNINVSASSHPPPIFSPLTPLTRAQMDADRLWAEHTLHNTSLLSKPSYLNQAPTTSHQATIQRELIKKWYFVLDFFRINAIKFQKRDPDHPDIRKLKAFQERIRCLAGIWQIKYVEGLEGTEQGQSEQVEIVQAPTKPEGKASSVVPRSRGRPPKQQPNFGFHTSTSIIPFDRSMSAPGSATGDVEAGPSRKKVRVMGLPTPEESPPVCVVIIS